MRTKVGGGGRNRTGVRSLRMNRFVHTHSHIFPPDGQGCLPRSPTLLRLAITGSYRPYVSHLSLDGEPGTGLAMQLASYRGIRQRHASPETGQHSRPLPFAPALGACRSLRHLLGCSLFRSAKPGCSPCSRMTVEPITPPLLFINRV